MASSTGWTGRFGHDNISSSASKASAPFQAIHILVVWFLLLCSSVICGAYSAPAVGFLAENQTFGHGEELDKLKYLRARLSQINKPFVKTIQSPDGDVIDCVLSHLQPAFEHPMLKGQKPSVEFFNAPNGPPEMPTSHTDNGTISEIFQPWSASGESCSEGTIPIRRATEQDLLRASSVRRFGQKDVRRVRRDTSRNDHEYAIGYVSGDEYYGAKASINVWAPRVSNRHEFSLSQMWVVSGSFDSDLNTVEAGWQIHPRLYGDSKPRLFTYWTKDAYKNTGCFDLLCSGFVQTSSRIVIGAAISPISSYRGRQFDITLNIWKDPNTKNWWLAFGSGILVGYWPSELFTNLRDHASMMEFGGEILNSQDSSQPHTETQMGSGHFVEEGFRRTSFFRNLETVDSTNHLIQLRNLRLLADNPNCYSIREGMNKVWGKYFYYGGPGRNVKCP